MDTCCRNNGVPVMCSILCNVSYAEMFIGDDSDEKFSEEKYKPCKDFKKQIGLCHIGKYIILYELHTSTFV